MGVTCHQYKRQEEIVIFLKYFSTLPFFASLIVLLSIKQIKKKFYVNTCMSFFRLMENCTNNGILNSSHCMGLIQTQKLILPLLEMTPLGLVINVPASTPKKGQRF